MKKTICVILSVMMMLGMTSCSAGKQKEPEQKKFMPVLDTSINCNIKIAGGYDNFEALETEFERFNAYYPNVKLIYTKVDDYNNMIGTVLNGNDAPDIYVNYSWMYGREQYQSSIDHAENLADPALGLDLNCLRGNIVLKTGRRLSTDGPGFFQHIRYAHKPEPFRKGRTENSYNLSGTGESVLCFP